MLLVGHPVEGLRARPVAAQPELQEAVTTSRAGLDQTSHRLAVAVERAELDVTGVGVGIEVDHRDPPVASGAGHTGHVRPGDGVVAPQNQRDLARLGDRGDRVLDDLAAAHHVTGVDLEVAGVDDGDVVGQRVDAHRHVRTDAVLRQVVGGTHGHRTEAGARSVAGATVERCTDDDDVGGWRRSRARRGHTAGHPERSCQGRTWVRSGSWCTLPGAPRSSRVEQWLP